LVVIITGTTTAKSQSRIAESYDGDPDGAPLLHVEYVIGPRCGDGIVEDDEQCDPGPDVAEDCCTVECRFVSAGTECRPVVGECDEPESCSGASAECPADEAAPVGTPCGDESDPCTLDVCDGSSPVCTHVPLPVVCGDGVVCGSEVCDPPGPGDGCLPGEVCNDECTACTVPRFVDNGDGTITDSLTGLMWEKKQDLDGVGNLANPHDADNSYSWTSHLDGDGADPDGTAFVDFLGELNYCESTDGATETGCFAGHCDWRLPTIVELQTILPESYPCSTSPCIDPIFGVTDTSLGYWSSTTNAPVDTMAWEVHFGLGEVGNSSKTSDNRVRAVRGGL
jgi:cysteine-rich repeat protein